VDSRCNHGAYFIGTIILKHIKTYRDEIVATGLVHVLPGSIADQPILKKYPDPIIIVRAHIDTPTVIPGQVKLYSDITGPLLMIVTLDITTLLALLMSGPNIQINKM
jgi:hypothetical protein